MGNQSNESLWRRYQLGAPIAGVMVVLIALVGISVSQAGTGNEADVAGQDEGQGSSGWGMGWHRGRGARGGFGKWRHDPERAKDHMQFAAGWMLHRMDIEDEVEEQIQARLATAFDELMPLMESHGENRGAWLEAVLRDEVDRSALEAQRQEAMAAADQASAIVVAALADVSEMLSPEQRNALRERIRSHHGH